MTHDRSVPVICLRCDWTGTSSTRACPECGTGLYREPPRPAAQVSPSAAARAQPPVTELLVTGPSEPMEPVRRPRAWLAAIVIVVVVAGGFWVLQARDPSAADRSADSLLRGGVLVYAVDEGPGWSRLWRWDLASEAVRRGPRIRQPIELVNADGAEPGMIGVTSQASDGDQIGSLLRFLSPLDRASRLGRGDLVTWGSRGASLVVVRRGPLLGPCRRHLAIVLTTIVPGLVERQFDRTMCGDILSVGRDSNTTYFTRRRGDQVDLVSAGYGRTHHVLSDFALLSISPASDMVVVRADALPAPSISLATLRERGDVPPPSIFGTSSFFRGIGGGPRPYRSGEDRMWIDRVVAWSRDSAMALVVGHLGDRVGLYAIAAGPTRRTEPPRYVGSVQGETWATVAEDGLAFVWTADRLFVTRGGPLMPLSLPEGAPRPDGPLVWLG